MVRGMGKWTDMGDEHADVRRKTISILLYIWTFS